MKEEILNCLRRAGGSIPLASPSEGIQCYKFMLAEANSPIKRRIGRMGELSGWLCEINRLAEVGPEPALGRSFCAYLVEGKRVAGGVRVHCIQQE